MNKLKLILTLLAAILSIAILGCNSEKNITEDKSPNLKILITDYPLLLDYVKNVNVTFSKVEVKSKTDNSKGEYNLVSNDPKTIDIAKLRNGITEVLGESYVDIPSCEMIRLTIDKAEVILENGKKFDLEIKSKTLDIPVKPKLEIKENELTELLLDFDLISSIKIKGEPENIEEVNGFDFNPEILALNMENTGIIEGKITDKNTGEPIKNSFLFLNTNKDRPLETITNENGEYKFLSVPEGIYSVYVSTNGYYDIRKDSVIVNAGETTTEPLELWD